MYKISFNVLECRITTEPLLLSAQTIILFHVSSDTSSSHEGFIGFWCIKGILTQGILLASLPQLYVKWL